MEQEFVLSDLMCHQLLTLRPDLNLFLEVLPPVQILLHVLDRSLIVLIRLVKVALLEHYRAYIGKTDSFLRMLRIKLIVDIIRIRVG